MGAMTCPFNLFNRNPYILTDRVDIWRGKDSMTIELVYDVDYLSGTVKIYSGGEK